MRRSFKVAHSYDFAIKLHRMEFAEKSVNEKGNRLRLEKFLGNTVQIFKCDLKVCGR